MRTMALPRLRSIRTMLFCLVLVTLLPPLGIILNNGFADREEAFRHAQEETVRLVDSLALIQERTTEAASQLLRTVALMPSVQQHDLQACSRLFQQILKNNPAFTNVLMTDAEGNIIASGLPFNATNLSDRKHFRDAVQNQRFSSGEYIVSRTSFSPAFPFSLPVIDDASELSGVLIAAIDLERYRGFFATQKMPSGAFMGMADRNGLRLYRSETSDAFTLGAPINSAVWNASRSGADRGVFFGPGSDGRTRITAFHRLRLGPGEEPYMTIFVGVPEDSVGVESHASMRTSLVLLGVAALLALSLAWAAERVLFMPTVQALVLAAERFRKGDYGRLTGVPHDSGELGLLASAMDRMAQETMAALDSMRSARDAAEDASRTKSEFLANMSHEIRTPLNGILGMLQLLQMSDPNEEQNGYIDAAVRSSSRLSRLLSDILDLSRIESNKLVIREGPFDISEVRQSIYDIFGVSARDKGLVLDVRMDPRIPLHLCGDEARLRQILFNLVGNAIKFTIKGRVEVSFVLESDPQSPVRRIRFTVADTGIGIAPERLGDVFDPFTQIDGSYVRNNQGAGLGLAIVRRLVDLMDGQISIESMPGKGTTVAVTLPFAQSGVSGALRRQYAERASISGLRILLVEDDEVNHLAMTSMLGKMGCAVLSASNGQEAVDLLRREEVDLVFMDIQMPVMDGVEATRIIRNELRLHVPIVALTAYAMLGDRERFLEGGMNAYVSKPVDMAQLQRVLEDAR